MYGRPVTELELARMVAMRRAGMPLRAIAAATGRKLTVVHARLRHVPQVASHYWSADEVATLQRLYPTHTPICEIAALLPKRKLKSIYRQARMLGLSRPAGGVRAKRSRAA